MDINIQQAAAEAGVSRRILYYWMKAGLLPYVRKYDSRFVQLADVLRLKNRREYLLKELRPTHEQPTPEGL